MTDDKGMRESLEEAGVTVFESATPEEAAALEKYGIESATAKLERRRQHEQRLANHRAAAPAVRAFDATIAAFRASSLLPMLAELLTLHQADDERFCSECGNGDYSFVDWPCPTVRIVCHHSGIEIPENIEHYDPTFEDDAP